MDYKNSPNAESLAEIEKTLDFIRQHTNGLIEKPGDSKWTEGNIVFSYPNDKEGIYTYMVGALKSGKVTWHIMPMYGVAEMKNKWSDSLAPFVSGKSCINFKAFSELPIEVITDITEVGTELFKKEMELYYAKRAKKKK